MCYAQVESGAAVNVQRHDGQTALMISAEAGAEELVACLLAARADLNTKCNNSRPVQQWQRCGNAKKDCLGLHIIRVTATP